MQLLQNQLARHFIRCERLLLLLLLLLFLAQVIGHMLWQGGEKLRRLPGLLRVQLHFRQLLRGKGRRGKHQVVRTVMVRMLVLVVVAEVVVVQPRNLCRHSHGSLVLLLKLMFAEVVV